MRSVIAFVMVCGLLVGIAFAQGRATNALTIYLIDVEGGNAQLYVTPSGASVLNAELMVHCGMLGGA